VFGRLIEFTEDAQPDFQSLDACRAGRFLDHGTVTVLGDDCHDDLGRGKGGGAGERGAADELRLREARDVVGAIGTALAEAWPVRDGDTLRPCRPGDICVLLPTRISLPALESELRAAQVPYRAENASVVYATIEIRDLLMVLRAADDPTDQLALLAALRSPLYGCSDTELYEWRRAGGSWGPWADQPPGLGDHPVTAALAHIRSVAERIGWVLPADILAAVVDERRLLDLALDGPDARDVWRRVRYVIDQARAWADAGGHGVRRYLAWAKLQAAERSVSDTILPEHDHDAVRVMTIHAAKGLEFPITIVAGLTTKPRRSQTTGVVWAHDSWMLAGRGDDGDFSTHQPLDELMGDAERRRLLYVACTRAVEHLVVSLHRARPTQKNADYADWGPLTSAELLWAAGASGPTSDAAARKFEPRPVGTRPAVPMTLDWSDPVEWAEERARALSAASRRTGIAATRLAEEVRAIGVLDDAGLDKHPVNVDLPAWQRGRYGTAIGRAVHGVLQFCDLATGSDIDTLARAQCAAEGVIGLDARVAALARSAIGAPIVRDVAGGVPHWRELFVAAPIGGRVVEGYVDLLVRTPDGLVIVDYKTDQWSGPAQSADRIDRYRIQLAAYGAALEVALGEHVVGGVLVHCRHDAAAEQIEISQWELALAEVRQLVS
jgi:ATP-dependent helicase/nuclease subunit A